MQRRTLLEDPNSRGCIDGEHRSERSGKSNFAAELVDLWLSHAVPSRC